MIGAPDITPLGAGWRLETKSPVGRFPSVLASRDPGSEQAAHFAGSTLALFYALGPDTGAFDYRIDEGPWQVLDPFDTYAKQYYRASYRILADGLPKTAHTLTIRIRAQHNADSKGDTTRIAYVLSND